MSIRSGNGVGKSTTLSWLGLHHLVMRYPAKVGTTAPSERQLRDVLWTEIGAWFRKMPESWQNLFVLTDLRLVRKASPDCFMGGRVASPDKPEAFAGYHSDNMLLMADEASGVTDENFEFAIGAMSTAGSRMILAGNPTRPSGFFYDTHHRMRDRWWSTRVNCEEVPRATHHIEDVISTYGKDSNAYRYKVLGEFPTTADEQVIPLDLVEAAIQRKVEPTPAYRSVWGVDVARFGNDRSAIAKRQGNRLLEPIEFWRNLDTMQTCGRIKADYDRCDPDERPSEILVDVIGIGAGVVDRLSEMGLPARGINVGESPSVSGNYMRLRDELWWKAREWFTQRDCSIPDDRELVSELIGPTYTFSSAGKLLVESKDDQKKRLGKSPDLADAFVLTMAGGSDRDYMAEEKKDRYSRRKDKNTGRSWMSA